MLHQPLFNQRLISPADGELFACLSLQVYRVCGNVVDIVRVDDVGFVNRDKVRKTWLFLYLAELSVKADGGLIGLQIDLSAAAIQIPDL